MTRVHLVTIHGLNTTNTRYFEPWIENIPRSNEMILHDVKWNSHSWHEDLLKISMSKYWRDQQIQKCIDKIQDREEGEPLLLLSHSWGTVWAYKAWKRLGETIKGPVWSIMVGAALGGTNLPYGGIYVKALRDEYSKSKTSTKIERMYNFYNHDDYVSTRIFMDRMENIRIDVPGFNPGLNEHDAVYYIKSQKFQEVIKLFQDKYMPQKDLPENK